MLSGEFLFKAKNYNVSNTFFLNLLQITFRNAIAPDYMENYMRQGKKTKLQCNFLASESLLGFQEALFDTRSMQVENSYSNCNSCNTSPERKSVPDL